jgi:hypothetical protein
VLDTSASGPVPGSARGAGQHAQPARLATCGRITGAVADTTSTWPPISAVTDSPDERNGAIVSLVDGHAGHLQRLGDGHVRVLAQRGRHGDAQLRAGSAFSAATRSCPVFRGESARTATSEVSSTIMATGMNSRGSALIRPVTAPAMLPVWKVPR